VVSGESIRGSDAQAPNVRLRGCSAETPVGEGRLSAVGFRAAISIAGFSLKCDFQARPLSVRAFDDIPPTSA